MPSLPVGGGDPEDFFTPAAQENGLRKRLPFKTRPSSYARGIHSILESTEGRD